MPDPDNPEAPETPAPSAGTFPPGADSGCPESSRPLAGPEGGARRFAWLPLLLVLVAGAAFRLDGLGEHWFHPDEGIQLDVALQGTWPAFLAAFKQHTHPPFYYIALRFWSGISHDPGWLRLLSVLAGLLILVAVHRLMLRLTGPAGAAAAAAAAAAAPGLIVLSQTMRQYAFLLLFEMATLLFLVRYLDTGRRRDLAVYAAALALAISAHYSMLLVLPALGALWLHQAVTRHWDRRRVLAAAAAHGPALLLAAGLIYRHIFCSIIGHAHGEDLIHRYLPYYFVTTFADAIRLPGAAGAYLFSPGAWLALAPWILAGLWSLWRRRRKEWLLFIGVTALVAVLFSWAQFYPLGSTRHSAYLLPLFLIPFGCIVQAVFEHGGRRLAAAGAATLAAAAALGALGTFATLPACGLQWAKEKTMTRAAFAAARAPLEAVVSRPGVLLMDYETFFTLAPMIGPDRSHGGNIGRPAIWTFRWRSRTVYVVPVWQWQRLEPRHGTPRILAAVLRRLGREADGAPLIARSTAVVRLGAAGGILPAFRQYQLELGGGWLTVCHQSPTAEVFLLDPARFQAAGGSRLDSSPAVTGPASGGR